MSSEALAASSAIGRSALVSVAEEVERESRLGHVLDELLERLDGETERARLEASGGSSGVAPPWIQRWQRVVESVRRDVESGRVRSVTGLAREARRLELQLETRRRVPAGP